MPGPGFSPKKQQSIASFFKAKQPTPATGIKSSGVRNPRRSASPASQVTNGEISDDEPPTKRRRSNNHVVENHTNANRSTALQERPHSNTLPQPSALPPATRVSQRTSKFLFSSPTSSNNENLELEDEDSINQKRKLHQRFVKKLGRPDSIAEIKRRNHHLEEDVAENEEDGEEEADEEPQAKTKKGQTAKKGGHKLTPMEKQVLELKRQHPDALLIVEVGYKFRFFGEDARVAAKELGIMCIPGKYRFDEHPSEAHLDRFASASVPVHRLHVHVKRLVAAGHKVGVIRQIETAALKKIGDNRNAPFIRKLTNLYTKGTYIDDVEGLEGPSAGSGAGAPSTGHLLCLTETNAKGWGTDEKVQVGIIAVQPATGDIIYDDFEDGFMRSEIETRLLHIAPCEFLIVGKPSKATEKLVQHLSSSKTNVFGDKARIEYVDKPKTMVAEAYGHISTFYADKVKSADQKDTSSGGGNVLDKIHKLTDHVTICLSAMIKHLAEYGLEHVFDLTKNFQSFSARSHMLLNGNTLSSLEIYRNQTDNSEKGSLFWVLDQTQTRFGQRLLRKWVGRPLLEKSQLENRIAAVEELKNGERTVAVDKLRHLLSKTKTDLEKSLIRIYYKKCTRPELLGVLQSLQRIATEYAQVTTLGEAGFKSRMINEAIVVLPKILEDTVTYLDKINPQAAKEDDKYNFFREDQETEKIGDQKLGIASVEHELDEHRKIAAEKLRKKKVEYVTVAGIEYLIEVENTQLKNVPASWAKISGTKKVSRFHTPEVVRMIQQRDQLKESLAAACDEAFLNLLSDISCKYQAFRDCIHSLATLDCLLSLAEVANRPDYVKPTFSDSTSITVTAGRHPMVEQLLLDSYVPNDIHLSTTGTRALLITGPNMGGKSSYVRQTALISIMGQIGSYVPAASAELGMLDAVFTRMGAFDNMMAGESTFMVELSETSDILKQATPRSLVILDELGRGTSTHDGVAIAHAVLDYIVRQNKSLLLFITHYQNLSTIVDAFDGEVKNKHMRFTEGDGEDQSITFLYELGDGVAHRSYGLNVARLANVPKSVINTASIKSKEMEADMHGKKLARLATAMSAAFAEGNGQGLVPVVDGIEQL